MLLSEYVDPGLSKKRIMEVFIREGMHPGHVKVYMPHCQLLGDIWLQVMSAPILLTTIKSTLARGNQC